MSLGSRARPTLYPCLDGVLWDAGWWGGQSPGDGRERAAVLPAWADVVASGAGRRERQQPWGLTYFGAGAQGRRAWLGGLLQEQGAGRPGPLTLLVLERKHLSLWDLDEHPLCTPPAPRGTYSLPCLGLRSFPALTCFGSGILCSRADHAESPPSPPPRMWGLAPQGHGVSRQQRRTQPDPEGPLCHLLSLLSFCWARAAPAGLLWAHRLCLLWSWLVLGLGVGVQMQLLQADSGWTQLVTILVSAGPVGGRRVQADQGSSDGLVQVPSHFPGSVSSSVRRGWSDQQSAEGP